MTRSGPYMYHELARYYDGIEAGKDYRSESKRLEVIARRLGRSGRTTWLDVACGTGRHLEFLSRRHPTVGVDSSPEMLRIARHRFARHPSRHRRHAQFSPQSPIRCRDLPLQRNREPEDRGGRPKDVRQLYPPFDPRRSRDRGTVDRALGVANGDDPPADCTRVLPPQSSALCLPHTGNPFGGQVPLPHRGAGRGIQHLEETDVGLMLSRDRLVEIMGSAGLHSRFLARGLYPGRKGRGLLVGVKSET